MSSSPEGGDDVKAIETECFRSEALVTDAPLLPESDYNGLRVFATSVIRNSSDHALTGYLFELDWPKATVRRKIPIPIDSSTPFWNPRGGNRGGRGIATNGDVLFVATATSVILYDKCLRPIRGICDPLLAGLHEIYAEANGLWLTSTAHDLIVKIGYDGSVLDCWYGSESPALQKAFQFPGRVLDLGLNFPPESFVDHYNRYCEDDRLHLNSVWKRGEEVYALACRRQALIRIRPGPEQVMLHDKSLVSPHNGLLAPDGRVLINNTGCQSIRTYDLATGRLLADLGTRLQSIQGTSTQFAKPGWQRGLSLVRDAVYLVGVSPATVFEVDIDKGVIGRVCRIDSDPSHCIHGLMATYSLGFADAAETQRSE
jgi:hypothetical protein